MAELAYLVPPEAEGKTLTHFLRGCGVTSGLIRSVKHQSVGFMADEKPVHTDHIVRAGETIRFALPPEQPTSVTPQPVKFGIVYEDEFCAVLEKPAGLAVHPTLNHPDQTLANGWLYHLRQCGNATGIFRPVNRLDKNTSGLVLCAQNAFAAAALAKTAEKRYLAIIGGRLPDKEGTVNAPIGRRGDSIIGRCVTPDGKPSVTRYRVLAQSEDASLLCCTTVTGRTHQIRVHMAYLGHPLLGDTLYGGQERGLRRHALHCAALRFAHPTSGQRLTFKSPLPQELCTLGAGFSEAAAQEDLF